MPNPIKITDVTRLAKKVSGVIMQYAILIVGIVIVLALIIWATNKLTLNDKNCRNMETLTSLINNRNTIKAIGEENCNRTLKDFYIKTAYNCCCAGNYKNDFVSICALKDCISQGIRCLDFEIYSVNGKAVVAASSVNNYTIKETYNSIPWKQVISTLVNSALGQNAGTMCPNPADPLILHLRIMSNNTKIYNEIAQEFSSEGIAQYILGPEYSYQYSGGGGEAHNAAGHIPIFNLKKKIFIMIDSNNEEHPLFLKTNLAEYVNLATNNPNTSWASTTRYYGVKHAPSQKDLIAHNRTGVTVCLPDLSDRATNFPFNIPKNRGCQMIAMSFQKDDSQLQAYIDFFNSASSAFVLQPKEFLETITCVPVNTPQLTTEPPEKIGIPGYEDQEGASAMI
jgi:hypothetical protein